VPIVLVIALVAEAAAAAALVAYAVHSSKERQKVAETRDEEAVEACLENAEVLVDLALHERLERRTRVA